MKLWLRVFLAATLATTFGIFVVVSRAPSDPAVNGRLASAWAEDLLSSDYKVRGEAQAALQSLGETAVPQVSVLLQRQNVLWQSYLVQLSTVLPFVKFTVSDAALNQQRGAEMIALLGPKGWPAIPDLIECLGNQQAAVEAERALLRVGDASVHQLKRALRGGNVEIRQRAARLLRDFARSNEDCAEALIGAARDKQPGVRREAALTLGELRGNDAVLAAVRRLAGDATPEVRAAAYESLGKLGDASKEVVETVMGGLGDRFSIVQLQAAKALWILTRDAGAAVPVLTRILPTPEGWQAAYALADMGPRAEAAVPALIQVLKKEKVPRAFRTPPSSAFALSQIQEAAIPGLKQVLGDREARVRLAAVLAFGFMGKHAREAVPSVLELLHDADSEVRHATAISLASMGAEPKLIVAGLSDCLRADDIYMRSAAAAVLREISPDQDWVVYPE